MQGVLYALAAALLFGLSNVLGRLGITHSSVYVAVTWNVLVNSILFTSVTAGWIVLNGRFPRVEPVSILYFAAAGLLIDFTARLCLYGAAARIGASRSSAFRVVAPVITVGVGLLFLGERLAGRTAAGVLTMLAGIAVVTWDSLRAKADAVGRNLAAATHEETSTPRKTPAAASNGAAGCDFEAGETFEAEGPHAAQQRRRSQTKRGLLYGALAAVTFGLGDVFRKQGMEVQPLAVMGAVVSSWAGLVAHLTLGLVRGSVRDVFRPGEALPYVVGSGLATGLAVLCLLTSLRLIPVSVATPVNGTQALFAVLFGWLLNRRQERITLFLIAGAALAVLGLGLLL